ncbi:hypothetical protein BK133_03985 [Paenibacillus sp. FSL H8-0548]|uniref:hypothetical protein n=1 Tax=Paenibacillus sp. FSL H8-0548 TaxID=1920422 RepID=UPI00096CBCE1|nr:hypothetical protein [Paenibacillus sp. FSL H8-0548]OMF37710.1 hypothetical protein BK133_03985 [Paenibacillus sp. FSL H8-0548]
MTGEKITKHPFKGLKGFKLKEQFLRLCLLLIVQGVLFLCLSLVFNERTAVAQIGLGVSIAVILTSFNLTRFGKNGVAIGTHFYPWSDFQSYIFNMKLSNTNEYYPNGKCLLTLRESGEEIQLFIYKESEQELKAIFDQYMRT